MSEYIKKEDAIKEATTWSMYGKDDLVSRLERLPCAEIVPIDEEWERGYSAGRMAERSDLTKWLEEEKARYEKNGQLNEAWTVERVLKEMME